MNRRILLAAGSAAPLAAISVAPPRRVPDSTTVLYIAGDSVAAGNYGITNLPQRDKLVTRVGDRLCGVNCNKPGYPVLVDVAVSATRLLDYQGTPGWQSNWATKILNAIPKPTTVLLQIGINDMGTAGVTDALFQAAYLDIYNRSVAAGIRLIPSTMFPINSHFSGYAVKSNPRGWMNEWIVRTFPIVARADLSAKLPWNNDLDCTYENNNGGVICQTGGDGLHPSRFGVISFADTVPVDQIV